MRDVTVGAEPRGWWLAGSVLALASAAAFVSRGGFGHRDASTALGAGSDGSGVQVFAVPVGPDRVALIESARGALAEYVRNPGSKITVKSSREEVLSQLDGLSDARTLEEFAKIQCVLGRGSEALRALATQLDIAESGNRWQPSDPSAFLVKIRLAQVFFTQGSFDRVRRLLESVLTGDALNAAPQWWGHLQWRLALRWSANPEQARMGEQVLTSLCLELRRRLDVDNLDDGGPCGGVASVGLLQFPAATAAALQNPAVGYGVVPGVLPAEVVDALRRRYFKLLARDLAHGRGGNDARQRRHGWHNEPVAGYFHYLVAEAVRDLDAELVPTYVYSVFYLEGGQLYPHLDRPDNEVSLTVSLGSEPSSYVWPLFMKGSTFELQPGDGVLYRGAEVEHARDPLPAGYRSLHIIFGFRRQCSECCHLT